jgi:hypothetical protein
MKCLLELIYCNLVTIHCNLVTGNPCNPLLELIRTQKAGKIARPDDWVVIAQLYMAYLTRWLVGIAALSSIHPDPTFLFLDSLLFTQSAIIDKSWYAILLQ